MYWFFTDLSVAHTKKRIDKWARCLCPFTNAFQYNKSFTYILRFLLLLPYSLNGESNHKHTCLKWYSRVRLYTWNSRRATYNSANENYFLSSTEQHSHTYNYTHYNSFFSYYIHISQKLFCSANWERSLAIDVVSQTNTCESFIYFYFFLIFSIFRIFL